MLVQVKELLYWKTEHGNANNCQDAPFHNAAQGLFAVADGAGTSLFPALWARILAQHFITTPLMNDDPFEVEWWVRLAQTEYKQQVPDIHKAGAWNVVQKVRNQGSDSTLATLRITSVDATTAEAVLLVFGDSCVLMGDPGKQVVSSFILQSPSEFDRAPICVPSDLKYFNRDFHRCQIRPITINAGDQIIIATDAISRWILGHGEMADVWAAFQQVHQCPTLDDWYALVDTQRKDKEMVNDDSTAIVLTFCEDSAGPGAPLDYAKGHTEEVIAERKKAFEEAASSDNKELLAIAYGDGNDFRSVTTTPSLDTIDIEHARKVADALKEVLRVFRLAQNSPDLVQKVKPVWHKYGHLLIDEPCAANLRETLRNNGIIRPTLAPAPVVQPKQRPASPISVSQTPVQNNIPMPPSEPIIPSATPSQDWYNSDPALEETIYIPLSKTPPTPAIDTPAEQKQRDLASERSQRELRLLRALYEKNEEDIVAAYEEIQNAGDQETLASINLKDRQNIEAMIQRRATLTNFRNMLQQGTYAQKLLRAYSEARQSNQSVALSQQEQHLLKLAQKFVDAYNKHDFYILEKVCRNINESGFKMHFTPGEMERINQASDFVKKQKDALEHRILAKVGNYAIFLKNFVIIYIIKQMYIHYLRSIESQLPSSPSAKASKQAGTDIGTLHKQLQAEDLPRLVLEEMIEHTLIHNTIRDMVQKDEFLQQQMQKEANELAENLQRHEERQPNSDFRRHDMGIEELKNFARMITEREMLANFLEAQKKTSLWRLPSAKKSALDIWLQEEREKEKKNIFFAEAEPYHDVSPKRILMLLEQDIKTYIYAPAQ